MTYHEMQMSNVENVGALDRVNRMIVSLTLAVVAVVFTAISPAATFSIIVASIYAGLTSAIGWDPLFVVVKALSQRAPEQGQATIATLARQEGQTTGGDFKKAA